VEDSLPEEAPQTATPDLEGPQTIVDVDPGPRGLVVFAIRRGFDDETVLRDTAELAAHAILGMLREGVPRVSIERIIRTV
jgi:hypothetical protein